MPFKMRFMKRLSCLCKCREGGCLFDYADLIEKGNKNAVPMGLLRLNGSRSHRGALFNVTINAESLKVRKKKQSF